MEAGDPGGGGPPAPARAPPGSLSVKTYWSVPVIVSESLFFLVIGLPIMDYARRQVHVA